jgi:hypothetical protein
MMMSLQWEPWKEQTRSYFKSLDPALLPVDPKSAASVVPQVYIIGNDPYYKIMTKMAQSKGWSVQRSFNTGYDSEMPRTKGHVLLIETHNGVPIIEPAILDRFHPGASKGLASPNRVVEIDGTTIMFVDLVRTLDILDDDGRPNKR